MQAGSTPTSTDSALLAELALSRGDLVQEWGYDDDVDVTFRDALAVSYTHLTLPTIYSV